MIFFVVVLILFQVGVSFYLTQKNAVLKEELAKEKLLMEGKENQIFKLKNQIQAHEQKLAKGKEDFLSTTDFNDLHERVQFPVVDMEDGTGLMIVRQCKNECIIKSVEYPNYDMGIMASKALTDFGFKLEDEYCEQCRRDGLAK